MPRRIIERERDLPVLQQRIQPFHLNSDNAIHLRSRESVEKQNLIQPIEKLRPEARPHDVHYLLTHCACIFAFFLIRKIFGPEIRCHDDKRVLEINSTPLTIRQPAIIKHLQ